jgi:hypothetical protein
VLFFGFNNEKFIHDFANCKAIGVKTELMVEPIIMPLEQNIVKPALRVVLGVKLFHKGLQLFENFTLCDLDNFDVIF